MACLAGSVCSEYVAIAKRSEFASVSQRLCLSLAFFSRSRALSELTSATWVARVGKREIQCQMENQSLA